MVSSLACCLGPIFLRQPCRGHIHQPQLQQASDELLHVQLASWQGARAQKGKNDHPQMGVCVCVFLGTPLLVGVFVLLVCFLGTPFWLGFLDAGFGPCFHLPGFHFGTGFLSHSQMGVSLFSFRDPPFGWVFQGNQKEIRRRGYGAWGWVG